jgi:hypothetical protein
VPDGGGGRSVVGVVDGASRLNPVALDDEILARDATIGIDWPGAQASGAGPQSCEARGTRRAWWRERIRGTPLFAEDEDGSWRVWGKGDEGGEAEAGRLGTRGERSILIGRKVGLLLGEDGVVW